MTQDAQSQNIQLLGQRGETLRLIGAYEEAIKIFRQLQKQQPENAWVNAHLGATYCQLIDYGNAIEYLERAIQGNDQYSWAYAQLGEAYRLRAIVHNRNEDDMAKAIEYFNKALGSEPEKSDYAWALAHLGAIYRLKMTQDINLLLAKQIDKESQKLALKCLDRAVELIPTYAWAWGMRATVYRLAQEYEDSYYDLEVETVIAPSPQVLQGSSSPVPLLESRRVSLHEHAFLSFYLTKNETDIDGKRKHYERAVAYALQALIVQPGDLIAKLIILVVKANRKKEEQGNSPSELNDLKEEVSQFLQYSELKFSEACKVVLRYLVKNGQVKIEDLRNIKDNAGEEHRLTKSVLEDVINNPSSGVVEDAELWLGRNFALTETSSNILFLLGNLSRLLNEDPIIGTEQPYRHLAKTINSYYFWERLYQTPVLIDSDRQKIFNLLAN